MTFISIFRTVALSVSLFFELIILGLAAHWTQGTLLDRSLYDFEIVSLLAGSLSTLALPTLLVVGIIRRNAFTSRICVELPVLVILWVLWLVNSALTAQWAEIFYPFGCGDLTPADASWCSQFFAIEGLSFVTWILLFVYTIVLLTYALIGQSRGNTVWTVGVSEAVFFAQPNQSLNKTNEGVSMNNGMYTATGTPAPIQNYQYPPGSVPMMQSNPAQLGQYGQDGINHQSTYPQV